MFEEKPEPDFGRKLIERSLPALKDCFNNSILCEKCSLSECRLSIKFDHLFLEEVGIL